MRKIFLVLFLLFYFFPQLGAYEKPKIITRESWGADEDFTYINSQTWKDIVEKRKNTPKKPLSKYQKKMIQKNKQATAILVSNFPEDIKIHSKIYEQDGQKLVWPIAKSSKIRGIIVHHTATKNKNSYDAVKDIYKYHALSRRWGDIGYNFLIGQNGEIFEGRKGGETAVGAHAKWNNIQTIGISIIGTYHTKEVNAKQYEALKKLTLYLVKKYDINLRKQQRFHSECFSDECEQPLKTVYSYPIIGHRDVGNTSCPGDKLYAQMKKLRIEITKQKILKDLNNQKYFKRFDEIGEQKLLEILKNIEVFLDKKSHKKILELKYLIIEYFDTKKIQYKQEDKKEKYIKVKLSYPKNDMITIYDGKHTFDIKNDGEFLEIQGQKSKTVSIKIHAGDYLEIRSWERKPGWDYKNRYNDNKFRGELFLYLENSQLIVVNKIKIEEYLKGLGEISEREEEAKAKAILIAARTYAHWYTTKARKFVGTYYDASDNPDVFQNYLGYSLEQRSPSLNNYVDETKGQVLTYNSELIKPWYFNASDGKTLSFYEYCVSKKNNSVSFCEKESRKYPFLQSKQDRGGIGKTRNGHGVGLPGTGASYFAKRGWNYEMILKYFYQGVEVIASN